MSFYETPPEENKPEDPAPQENPPEKPPIEDIREQYENEIPPEEEESTGNGNRTFLTVVSVIGAIVLIAVIVLVGYFLLTRGRLATRFQQQAAQVNAENTAVAIRSTESSLQEIQQMTQKAILPATWTATPKVSNTSAPTSAPAVDSSGKTATVAAFLTQSAQAAAIGTPIVQPTQVPTNTKAAPTTQAAVGTPVAQATLAATATARATATTAATARMTATATARASATPLKTATALPQTGFAEDVGLPGLFGMALSLVVLVVVVRRIRFSLNQ